MADDSKTLTIRRSTYANELHVVIVATIWWDGVVTAGRQLELRLAYDPRAVAVGQIGQQTPSVPIIGHPAAVVTLAGHVGNSVERNVLVLVNKHLPVTEWPIIVNERWTLTTGKTALQVDRKPPFTSNFNKW